MGSLPSDRASCRHWFLSRAFSAACRSVHSFWRSARISLAFRSREFRESVKLDQQLGAEVSGVEPRPAPQAVPQFGTAEDPRQGVVVRGGDRIELVVVAAGAPDAEREDRAGRGIDHLVRHVHVELLGVDLVEVVRAEREESRRNLVVHSLLGAPVRQQVARDLLTYELVERLVVVERADDVVAVPPCDRERKVPCPAHRVGIAHDIQPVPAPALAEPVGFEQPVHHPVVRPVTVVTEEVLKLLGRRRQAGQVQRCPPEQVFLPGIGGGSQPVLFQPSEHQLVDSAGRPRQIRRGRRLGFSGNLERPELPALVEVDRVLGDLNLDFTRVRRPHPDPFLEVCDHIFREAPAGRHLERAVIPESRQNEAALDIPGHHGMAALAALAYSVPRVQTEPAHAHLRLGGVACVAVRREDGANLRFEELDAFGSRRLSQDGEGGETSGYSYPRNAPNRHGISIVPTRPLNESFSVFCTVIASDGAVVAPQGDPSPRPTTHRSRSASAALALRRIRVDELGQDQVVQPCHQDPEEETVDESVGCPQ